MMPFSIRKQGNKFQVVNSETGDVKGTFNSRDDADKQLRALYANVPDARKDKGHMEVKTKAVNATINDTSADADEYPGTFVVELSNESLDRDGDVLKSDEWETPLPEQITFVNDHTHKMASVVGSAKPELVGGKIICKGEWAATDNAQDTRKVIKHVPYVSVTYREKQDRKAGTVSRELVNGSFVVVPSNTKARVLASKSAGEDLDDEVKEFIKAVAAEILSTKDTGGTKEGNYPEGEGPFADPKNRKWPLNTAARVRNAWARINQEQATKNYSAQEVSAMKGRIRSAAKDKGVELSEDGSKEFATLELYFKDGDEYVKFSQAPESAPNGSDSSPADQAKEEAAALAKLKAAVIQMETRQFTEQELNNA